MKKHRKRDYKFHEKFSTKDLVISYHFDVTNERKRRADGNFNFLGICTLG